MALMQPPNDIVTEDMTDEANVIALEEDGDVEQENSEYSGVVGFINSAFQRSKDARLTDETRWLDSYRNYRGIYGPEVQFTDTEKSKAFVKITKTKVLAAYSQIIDVLFAGSKFPIGIESRKFPSNVAGEVSYDPNALTTDKVKEKTGMDYTVPRNISRPDIAKDLGIYSNKLKPIHDDLELGAGTNPLSQLRKQHKTSRKRSMINSRKRLPQNAFDQCLLRCRFLEQVFLKGRLRLIKNTPNGMQRVSTNPSSKLYPR
jgi:hypothetical protein